MPGKKAKESKRPAKKAVVHKEQPSLEDFGLSRKLAVERNRQKFRGLSRIEKDIHNLNTKKHSLTVMWERADGKHRKLATQLKRAVEWIEKAIKEAEEVLAKSPPPTRKPPFVVGQLVRVKPLFRTPELLELLGGKSQKVMDKLEVTECSHDVLRAGVPLGGTGKIKTIRFNTYEIEAIPEKKRAKKS